MTIKAILFDLDDTLMPEAAAVSDAFNATCRLAGMQANVDATKLKTAITTHSRTMWHNSPWYDYGKTIGIASWEAMSAGFWGSGPHLEELRYWISDYRLTAWQKALRECGNENMDLAASLAEQFIEEKANRYAPFSGVKPLLTELRDKYQLGMITNGVPDMQQEKFIRTGLLGFFRPLLISGEIGIGKPDPLVFHLALDALKLQAQEVLMVGDSLNRDIAGARAAGLRCVWICPDQQEAPPEAQPDVKIRIITELPNILARFENETND